MFFSVFGADTSVNSKIISFIPYHLILTVLNSYFDADIAIEVAKCALHGKVMQGKLEWGCPNGTKYLLWQPIQTPQVMRLKPF